MIPIAALGVLKNWKFIGIAAGVILLLLFIWAAYAHYQGLLLKVDQLTIENAQVRMSTEIQATHLAQQKTALDQWKKAQDELVKNYHSLSIVAYDARRETSRLNDLFTKHNFSALATKKPGLIENRINSGTASLFKLFECETGNRSSCPRNTKAGKSGSP